MGFQIHRTNFIERDFIKILELGSSGRVFVGRTFLIFQVKAAKGGLKARFIPQDIVGGINVDRSEHAAFLLQAGFQVLEGFFDVAGERVNAREVQAGNELAGALTFLCEADEGVDQRVGTTLV